MKDWDLSSNLSITACSDKVNRLLLDFKMHHRKERGRKFESASFVAPTEVLAPHMYFRG